jgi:hypothetical protein
MTLPPKTTFYENRITIRMTCWWTHQIQQTHYYSFHPIVNSVKDFHIWFRKPTHTYSTYPWTTSSYTPSVLILIMSSTFNQFPLTSHTGKSNALVQQLQWIYSSILQDSSTIRLKLITISHQFKYKKNWKRFFTNFSKPWTAISHWVVLENILYIY